MNNTTNKTKPKLRTEVRLQQKLNKLEEELKNEKEYHKLAVEESKLHFISLYNEIDKLKDEKEKLVKELKEKDFHVCMTKCGYVGFFIAITLSGVILLLRHMAIANAPADGYIQQEQVQAARRGITRKPN